MNAVRTLVLTSLLGAASVGIASASTISFVSNIVAGPTELPYTLTLQKFDASLGTLTGVTLYFKATENTTNLTLSNTGVGSATFDAAATANLVRNFANTATAADIFNGEQVTIFDTGISLALGSCAAGKNPAPGGCAQITLAGGASKNYASPTPIVVNNTDAAFGLATGTGTLGVFGVTKAGTSIANYIGAAGTTFALSGTTLNSITFAGAGGNVTGAQSTNASFQAEVDYTYTPGNNNTPEPATMALVAGGLALCGLLRKRIVS